MKEAELEPQVGAWKDGNGTLEGMGQANCTSF
jgi:hypothetical protein